MDAYTILARCFSSFGRPKRPLVPLGTPIGGVIPRMTFVPSSEGRIAAALERIASALEALDPNKEH